MSRTFYTSKRTHSILVREHILYEQEDTFSHDMMIHANVANEKKQSKKCVLSEFARR